MDFKILDNLNLLCLIKSYIIDLRIFCIELFAQHILLFKYKANTIILLFRFIFF